MSITVGWRGGALEDPLGHLDRVHQGVVHAGQFLAEALQHGVEHGVELAGEVVQRGEAPVLVDALGVAGVVSYGQLRRAAAHQRRADDAESLCPGAVQVLPPPAGRISLLENQTSRRIAKERRGLFFSGWKKDGWSRVPSDRLRRRRRDLATARCRCSGGLCPRTRTGRCCRC
jgi:hypothetical protein